MHNFAILSPYVIPPSMPKKRVNVGDGFILKGIERQIGPFDKENVFTSRAQPNHEQLASLQKAGTVILGGANQLDDNFQVWPNLTARQIQEIGIKFVPFAIGINGMPERNQQLGQEAIATLSAIHERIAYSSWRCPLTVNVIEQAIPSLRGRALMTGCPVLYDAPLLGGKLFSSCTDVVAVSVTDRGDFWKREAETLLYVAKRYSKSQRYLVLHQVFEERSRFRERLSDLRIAYYFLKKRAKLQALARDLGYTVIAPPSADAAIEFYKSVDLHIGSRLHAHLHFLSQSKRSFLTYVDDRMTGFSKFLGFPLCTPETFSTNEDFDFEVVRRSALNSFAEMQKFVHSLEVNVP